MDDDDRRELDELRRRAYGPGDGLTDARDVDRLRELEDHRRPRAPVGDVSAEAQLAEASRGEDVPSADSGTGGGGSPTDRRRRRLLVPGIALAAAVLLAVVLPRLADAGPSLRRTEPGPFATPTGILATPLAVHLARRFTHAPSTASLLEVRLLAAFDGPTPQPVPGFPVTGSLRWVDTVGDYFGARVWRARAESGEVCLLIELPSITRASCVVDEEFELDAMLVVAPFLEIPEAERPEAMRAGDALGFWWRSNGRLEVLLGRSPYALG